jgi:hypothetical protein
MSQAEFIYKMECLLRKNLVTCTLGQGPLSVLASHKGFSSTCTVQVQVPQKYVQVPVLPVVLPIQVPVVTVNDVFAVTNIFVMFCGKYRS